MSWQRSCFVRQLPLYPHTRPLSTGLHFYRNRQLDIYAAKEAHRLTLRQLVYHLSSCQSAPTYPYRVRSSLDDK